MYVRNGQRRLQRSHKECNKDYEWAQNFLHRIFQALQCSQMNAFICMCTLCFVIGRHQSTTRNHHFQPHQDITKYCVRLTNMASSIPPAMDRPVAITSRKDRTHKAPEQRRTIMTSGRGARCIPRNSAAVCCFGFFAVLEYLSSLALDPVALLLAPSVAAEALAVEAFFLLRTGILTTVLCRCMHCWCASLSVAIDVRTTYVRNGHCGRHERWFADDLLT